jgi:hypothetical protein
MGPGGCFVVEVMVPQLQRLPPGETVHPFLVSTNQIGFDVYDIASQVQVWHHYSISGAHARVESIAFRYVCPAELDLMARLAGMTLRGRWCGWKGEPFTSDSAVGYDGHKRKKGSKTHIGVDTVGTC